MECWKLEGRKSMCFSLVLFKSKYGGVPPIFGTVISVHLKGIGQCCNILLGGQCICLSGGATATNLNKDNKKMEDFGQCY